MAFGLVHAWLTYLGVVVVPAEAFHDVDLYRYWMYLGLHDGSWPVLDQAWVYPVGALVPMLVPALVSTYSTPLYALAWCAMVTVLDALAVTSLLRPPPEAPTAVAVTSQVAEPAARPPRSPDGTGAWWWLAFLALLGPVAVGRLDAVIAPLMLVSLVAARRTERGARAAAALLTFGAWVKVAPGALLLPLVAAARRPLRDVVVPAAVVCGAVVSAVAAAGGLSRITGFLTAQQGRGLQVESVTATPWVLMSLVRDDVAITLNDPLVTYEVTGPGTATAASVLDAVLVVLVAAVAVVLLAARRRGRSAEALLPGALTLLLVLIVANKVGSPQFLTWVAAPVAVLVTDVPDGRSPRRRPRWVVTVAVLALVAAGLTQLVFPWGYMSLLTSSIEHPTMAVVLAVRNGVLLGLLACGASGLVQAVRSGADETDRAADATTQPIRGTTS